MGTFREQQNTHPTVLNAERVSSSFMWHWHSLYLRSASALESPLLLRGLGLLASFRCWTACL